MPQNNQQFTPKSILCLREGYSFALLLKDLLAGVTVGIISIPLTMAFAIASGVSPEKGLITGIIAGFLISLLGGSRVQIGGPTGAFAVIVYSVVMRQGFDGLVLATLLAGCIMVLLSLCRAGALLKFIPHSVTTGFTAGIALTIFSSQIKDLFGLKMESVPIEFLDKWHQYALTASTFSFQAAALGLFSLALLFLLKRFLPKWPAPIFAVLLGSWIVYHFELPIETIQTKFGGIPSFFTLPSIPSFTLDKLQAVFPDALTIAFLGSVESLLSAVIADGMTGHRHRSNMELLAQGIANVSSALFGGIPATGAIARTAANIRLGAKTPVAGMTHALTIAILAFFFADSVALMPLPVLAAILIYVAWNMSEMEQIRAIFHTTKGDIAILLLTFALTVLIDLTVAVQVGVLIAAVLFMKKMTDATSVKAVQLVIKQEGEETQDDSNLLFRKDIPEDTVIFEMDGPLFFGSAYSLTEALSQLNPLPKRFILQLDKVPLIDASGAHALTEFAKRCKTLKIQLVLSGVDPKKHALLQQGSLRDALAEAAQFPSLSYALKFAKA